MTDEELAEIEARVNTPPEGSGPRFTAAWVFANVPALIAEVRRLRESLQGEQNHVALLKASLRQSDGEAERLRAKVERALRLLPTIRCAVALPPEFCEALDAARKELATAGIIMDAEQLIAEVRRLRAKVEAAERAFRAIQEPARNSGPYVVNVIEQALMQLEK